MHRHLIGRDGENIQYHYHFRIIGAVHICLSPFVVSLCTLLQNAFILLHITDSDQLYLTDAAIALSRTAFAMHI